MRQSAGDARADSCGTAREDPPRSVGSRDRNCQRDGHLQHESPGCGTPPDGVAAATGPGRGMPADGHFLNSCVHWHACDPNNMWRHHPDNDSPESWRDMAARMREATDIARQANVVLAFEP